VTESLLRPGLWPLLLAAPVAAAALVLLGRGRSRRRERVAGPRSGKLVRGGSAVPRGTGTLLFALGVLCAAAALLEPLGDEKVEAVEERGVDLVVCLDVSRSMLARDVAPSRLESARRAVRELAARARGDRLALVAFAGEARLLVPLTRDGEGLAALADLAGPLSVARGGTDLGAALDTALAALEAGEGGAASVILLTDGEDLGGRGREAAARCRERGVVVHTVGFGSSRGGKIPVEGAGGERFLRDEGGREIVTALDPVSLRAVAEATGGTWREAGQGIAVVGDLHEEAVRTAGQKVLGRDERSRRERLFQWPLLGAILLWMGSLWIHERS